jgi:hypothetical protein
MSEEIQKAAVRADRKYIFMSLRINAIIVISATEERKQSAIKDCEEL